MMKDYQKLEEKSELKGKWIGHYNSVAVVRRPFSFIDIIQ